MAQYFNPFNTVQQQSNNNDCSSIAAATSEAFDPFRDDDDEEEEEAANDGLDREELNRSFDQHVVTIESSSNIVSPPLAPKLSRRERVARNKKLAMARRHQLQQQQPPRKQQYHNDPSSHIIVDDQSSVSSAPSPNVTPVRSSSRRSNQRTTEKRVEILITLHEEMHCFLNRTSNSHSIRTEGTVRVDYENNSPTTSGAIPLSLCFSDPRRNVMKVEKTSPYISDMDHNGDGQISEERLYRVIATPPDNDAESSFMNDSYFEEKNDIVGYICYSKGSDVPILCQTRVESAGDLCRVLLTLKAGLTPLKNVSVAMAVPFSVHGRTVKMPAPRGTWNEMKRLIHWKGFEMNLKETVSLMCQFEVDTNLKKTLEPEDFPILLQCEGNDVTPSGVSVKLQDKETLPPYVNAIIAKKFTLTQRC